MPNRPKVRPKRPKASPAETARMLHSLRVHGQVVEAATTGVELGPGQTHVLVKKPGKSQERLVELRKSLIKR